MLGLPAWRVAALLAPHRRVSARVPEVGELRVTGRALWLCPREGGGFDGVLGAGAAAARCLSAGCGVEVLAVQAGRALLRLIRAGSVDLLAWVRVGDCLRLWGRAMQA
ncbi:hypothetical protein ACFP81_02525 [Deinococcus lacus]|uniref:DUF2917 domain-containing protein n=1 Tax=Deinococcus lacus TaxID=392561 RepID=A0ABW1Y9P4_9DEIO